jgi:hypothetical protein
MPFWIRTRFFSFIQECLPSSAKGLVTKEKCKQPKTGARNKSEMVFEQSNRKLR